MQPAPENQEQQENTSAINTRLVRAHKELNAGGKGGQYMDWIVGRRGLIPLLRYDLIQCLCQGLPGALGFILRRRLYPCLLKQCGKNVVFGRNVTLRCPNRIEIGDNVYIDDNCLLDAKGYGASGIRIGSDVFIGRNSILSCKNGQIDLGDRVNIGFNCTIYSGSRVMVEQDVLLAAYVYLVGGDHEASDSERPISEQGGKSIGIRVGKGAWLGAGATLLDGTTVGRNSIVGAGAVVTRSVPGFTISAGVPARPLKKRSRPADSAE